MIWISPGGDLHYQHPGAFEWRTVDTWPSDATGAVYPNHLKLVTTHPETGAPATFELVPKSNDQEFRSPQSGTDYWEGACRVLDGSGNAIGEAYLELTGYARPLEGLR